MKEILTSGNVEVEFKRLGVSPILTYGNERTDYKVYELTEEDFEILCNEPDIDNTWIDCAWIYCEGSNQSKTNEILKVNGADLKCWYKPLDDEDYYYDDEEEIEREEYEDLLTYLCWEIGASTMKNVCALCMDLAKYNDMKLSELFRVYQGEI